VQRPSIINGAGALGERGQQEATLGMRAFGGCSGVTSVTVPRALPYADEVFPSTTKVSRYD